MLNYTTVHIYTSLEELKAVKKGDSTIIQGSFRPTADYWIGIDVNGIAIEFINDSMVRANLQIVKEKNKNDIEELGLIFAKSFEEALQPFCKDFM